MDVPSATSAGRQLWVRGPTAQQAAPAPAAPNTRARPAAQAAPPPAAVTGPAGPAAPAERSGSPHRGQPVAWVNAHGGAGASTLAHALGGADVGRRWPEPARGEPGRVLLVARTHATGMRAVSQALNALRKGDHPTGVRLIAVVLVADAPGRLPRPLGRRVRVLRSAAKVHRVPWVPAWRLGEEADPPPREVRRLAGLVPDSSGRTGGPR
ncbi:DUF6668 family protein [Streptomyces sp. TRM 70361]|uniref:DUF6668 family protein n=1 Tax=Streptomyces sp. TRM 70361 TaxID=3116553 RepID=UPI002E7BD370|nr:DUF6668 family protein [Streptomyces sp. TRM 70361]MEE1940979.1 DUF6668 family protein [Streptomyces sp. TRM 70361]